MSDLHYKIIVPMYNVENWIGKNLLMIKQQDYENFQCVVCDDMSTDGSIDAAKTAIDGDSRFSLITNKEKKFALRNIYESIIYSNPEDDDVIATVDGDDWLANAGVLSIIKEYYESSDIMMTYGSYIRWPTGEMSSLSMYPDWVIKQNAFRDYQWMATHLRTFKYNLWKRINKEDLLGDDGDFYKMAWDLAFGFPMLEMSSGKFKHISDTLYVYNRDNPINDDKVNKDLQLGLDKVIRRKPKYLPLEFSDDI